MNIEELASNIRTEKEEVFYSLGLDNTSEDYDLLDKVMSTAYSREISLLDKFITTSNKLLESDKLKKGFTNAGFVIAHEARLKSYYEHKEELKNKISLLKLKQ